MAVFLWVILMANQNIPIRDIPGSVGTPNKSTLVAMDNGITMQKTTVQAIVEAGRIVASQLKAEAGADNVDVMTALRVAQAIEAQGDNFYAVKGREINAGTGLAGGGTLEANRTIALNSTSIASLAKADSALQSADIGASIQGHAALLDAIAGLSLADGDLFVADGPASVTTLGKGTEGQVLGVVGGNLAYKSVPAVDLPSPPVANTVPVRKSDNSAYDAKPVGTTGLAVLGAETQQAGRDALGIIPTFSVRDVTAATAATAQADGTIVRIAGYPYKVDSTATGEDSLTYDLGVDGLVPLDRVTPRMCGAVGDGGTGAGTNDRAAIQRAWVIAAAHKVPCFMEGLKYNSDEAIYTDSNLHVVGQGAEIFFTGWPLVGGFITNVWGGAHTANAPERRVQSNVNLYDLEASGELLPAPGPTENSNLFGFARGMYGARVVDCVARKMRLGFGGGTGGGGFGDEQGTHDVAYINCRAEDCYRGTRVAGMSGNHADSAAEPKTLTRQRFIDFTAVRCGTAIFGHTIGAPSGDRNTSNLSRFDATFEGVTHIEDCGHYPWTPLDFDDKPNISPQKNGVVTLSGATAIYIADMRVKISSAYTSTPDWLGQTGYPAGGTNFIGAGLSGNVGALVRGWGRDVVIGRVTLQGSLDCFLDIDLCVAMGEIGSVPPTNLADKVSIAIGSIDHISGTVERIVDGATGLANAKIGVELNDINLLAAPTVEYASTAAALDNIMIEIVNSAGRRMRGRASQFVPAPAVLYPSDHVFMGSLSAGGGYSSSGSKSGLSYDGLTARFSSDTTTASGFAGFYNPNGLVGQITSSGTSTSYLTSSDETWKEFKGELAPEKAIGIILSDPVREWEWSVEHGGGEGIGWGAQTSYGVSEDLAVPGGWFLYGDRRKPCAKEDEGAEYIPWAVDKSARVPYLWAATTRLLSEIEDLKNEIASLKAGSQ